MTLWGGGAASPAADTPIVCSSGRPHQIVRRGVTRSRAVAVPPGASRTLAGSSATLVASPPSAADSAIVAGALPLLVSSTSKRAERRLRRRCGRARSATSWYGRTTSVAWARATTSPRERDTASIVSGHSRASASGERGGASTISKRCSWPSPAPNGSR